ncbi:MAG: winged helix-turn-helix domain-containing protein, partial [Candidatus Competibacteraceae bacterium]
DDYVIKPFSPRELTARIKAVLRRTLVADTESSEEPVVQPMPFVIDEEQYRISYWGRPLTLSRYEFRLLQVLLKHPDRVYSREMLLSLVWDDPESSFDRTVDTHIKTIRAKLRAIKPDANPIKTHRGFGYSLSLS